MVNGEGDKCADMLSNRGNQLNNIWKNKKICINNKVRKHVAGLLTISKLMDVGYGTPLWCREEK